jgi:hypothetical protein
VGETVINDLEKTIKTICKAIRKDGDCKPEKMTALARLVNSLTSQESQKVDPLMDGDPMFHESLEAPPRRRKNPEE